MDYRFSNALGYTQTQLAELHTIGFTGYFFPMVATPESSADSWRVYAIDANRSIIMRDASGAFVGLARVAVRGTRGWCAGFGIAPAFRGMGAGTALAARMAQVARETGLATLQLEVLEQNIAAQRAYERAGFTTRRQVVIVEGATAALPEPAASVRIEDAGWDVIVPHLVRGELPVWQRELATLLTLDVTIGAVRSEDGRVSALAVHRANGRAQILAHATESATSDDELLALLHWAGRGMERIHLSDEPEDSPFLARLRTLGFTEIARQREMLLAL